MARVLRPCNTRQIWQQQQQQQQILYNIPYMYKKKVETKPSSRLSLSASGARSNWESFMAFQLFPLRFNAATQPTTATRAIRAALLFPFRFQVAYLRFWFATVFFRDMYVFRILKRWREPSLPLYWRTTGRALTWSVPHEVVVFVSKLLGGSKKAVPESQVALAACTLYNGQATLLVLVLVLVNSQQHRFLFGQWFLFFFVYLLCLVANNAARELEDLHLNVSLLRL